METETYPNRWPQLQHFTIGLWILSLYILFLASVIFSLSIHQFQHEIKHIPLIYDTKLDGGVISSHKCDISGLKDKDASELKSTLVLLPCFKQSENEKLSPETALDKLKRYNFGKSMLERKKAQAQVTIDAYESQLDKNKVLNPFEQENYDKALHKKAEAQKGIDKLEDFLKNIGQIVEDSKFYDGLFTWFLPLDSTAASSEKIIGFKYLWGIPAAFLSMVLVLSMGGLGSLITITIDYLKLKSEDWGMSRFSNYLFRPLLGGVMALAVYIAIKSGQAVSGEFYTEISPYLLSFIGILAGLMTEHFYKKLVSYGEKLI